MGRFEDEDYQVIELAQKYILCNVQARQIFHQAGYFSTANQQ